MPITPEAAQIIQNMIGVNYLWGGTGEGGVDCSGFTQMVFGAMGVQLPRVSNDQARSGAAISMQDAQPGDLVWWDLNDRNDGADHVGVYLGNGKVAEASSGRGQVVVRNLWGNAQFTRLGNGGAGGGMAPTAAPAEGMQGLDMADVVKSPIQWKDDQGEGDGGASFNLGFLYDLADEEDPGETAETVGPYGVAKTIFDLTKNVMKQSRKVT